MHDFRSKLEISKTELSKAKVPGATLAWQTGGVVIDRLNQLVSKEGRISRNGYIQAFVIPLAVMVGVTWLALLAFPAVFGGVSSLLFVAPWMMLFATADAQNIKRYHDLGNSARIYRLMRPIVMAAPVVALIVQFVLPAHMAMMGDAPSLIQMIGFDMNPGLGTMPTVVIFLTIAAILSNTAYLACMPGQKGPNGHGPDPLSGVTLPGVKAAASGDSDPVKRALAEYQARVAQPGKPKRTDATVQPVNAARSGAGAFGRKRTR